MIYIGNHLSSSKGFAAMGKAAQALGGDTFAFFTRNPRGGSAKEIIPEDTARLCEMAKEEHFGTLVAHAPYTMNVCSAKEDIRQFSKDMLKEDLLRMEYTPGNYYNFHPGSHTGLGTDVAIPMIAEAINEALTPELHTTILLETMAGKGSEVGKSFEELRAIIDLVELKEKVGVCFDTCHVWDGGYDIVNNLDGVLEEFDRIIGLDKLKAIHLNDSMNPLGAKKDRHARLGEGYIGLEALKRVINHPALHKLPFYLETPNDLEGYAREIHIMREAWKEG